MNVIRLWWPCKGLSSDVDIVENHEDLNKLWIYVMFLYCICEVTCTTQATSPPHPLLHFTHFYHTTQLLYCLSLSSKRVPGLCRTAWGTLGRFRGMEELREHPKWDWVDFGRHVWAISQQQRHVSSWSLLRCPLYISSFQTSLHTTQTVKILDIYGPMFSAMATSNTTPTFLGSYLNTYSSVWGHLYLAFKPWISSTERCYLHSNLCPTSWTPPLSQPTYQNRT